jgi:hypothetical protein
MAQTNVQAFSGDVEISGETVLGTATYRKQRDWNRNALAYVYLGNIQTNTTTGIRLDVSLNSSNSGYQMTNFQINVQGNDPSHAGGKLVYSVQGTANYSILRAVDIGYVYVGDGGAYEYQLWLKDPTTDTTGGMDAYLNCQGYYNFDTGVSDVAQGGAAPTNFQDGIVGVLVDNVGNVGIGTTNPRSKLYVEGGLVACDTAETSQKVLIPDGDGTGATNNEHNIGDLHGGVAQFVSEQTSDYNLPSISILNKDRDANTDKNANIGFFLTDAVGTGKYAGRIGFWPENENSQLNQFRIYTTGTQAGYTYPEQRVVVTGSGNVGIGTTVLYSVLNAFGGNLWNGSSMESHVCATLQVNRGSGSGASAQDSGYGAILEFRHHSDTRFATVESVSEQSFSGRIGFRFKTRDGAAPVERMRIGGNGNVGIGTDDPQGKLHISSGTSGDCIMILEADTDNNNEGDNCRIEFRQDGGIAPSAILQSDNYLDFKNSTTVRGGLRFFTGGDTNGFDNAVERMHIDENGNVGIGTASPECMLHLSASTASSNITDPITIKINNRRGAGDWSITQPWGLLEFDTNDTSGTGEGPVAGVGCRFEAVAGGNASLCFYTDGDNAGNNVLGPASERMCIDHDGNVGIGTTNPIGKLDVFGGSASSDSLMYVRNTANANTDRGAGIFFENRADNGTRFSLGHILARRENKNGSFNSYLRFSPTVNGTLFEAMRIKHDGNVGIGTTNATERLLIQDLRSTTVIIEDSGTDNGTHRPSLVVRSPGTSRGTSETDGVVLLGVSHDGNSGGNNYNRLGWDGAYQNRMYLMRLAGYSDYGSGDSTVGFLAGTGTETAINFTGQHRTFIKDTPFVRAEELEGLIVSSDQNKYIKMSGGIESGSNAITINESLPVVSISTKVKDKKCFGVISSSEDPDSREDTVGIFTSVLEKEEGDTRVYINSVGEGGIWVVNTNGILESGDYITTSNVAGYGQKQDSEFLANYTVAKITMDCDFNPVTQPIQIIRKETSGVNYWVKTTYKNVSEEEYSNLTEENRRTITETAYTNEDGVTFAEQTIYQKITVEESKTEREGWELTVRQELVNVLDEHGQIQWEDHPTETEKAYKIRYLDADGNITDEANHVYKAAFVGCTYHCG